MKTQWPRFRWFTLTAFLAGLLSTAMLLTFWIRSLPLVERYDMDAFVRTSVPDIPFFNTYTLVVNQGHLAMPEESGTFRLQEQKHDSKQLNAWLHMWVYHTSVWWYLKFPLVVSLLLFIALLLLGKHLDDKYNTESRDGQILRGPKLVTARDWNRRVKDRHFYIESK